MLPNNIMMSLGYSSHHKSVVNVVIHCIHVVLLSFILHRIPVVLLVLALVQSLITARCSMKHFNSSGEWTMPIHKSDSKSVDAQLGISYKQLIDDI